VPSDTVGLQMYPAGSRQAKDYARRDPRYRDVWSLWLMPATVDLKSIYACLWCDAGGNPLTIKEGGDPPRQMFLRHTLRWIPLRSDYDWRAWPPMPLSPPDDADFAPQFLPPQVFLSNATEKYRAAEMCGIHVAAPRHGLGVRLQCHPKHLVAVGDFDTTSTLHQPRWEGNAMSATVAFESDARLALEYDVPGGDPVDGVLEVLVSDAEMWVVAPLTALAVSTSDATALARSPNELEILRDDRPRLAMVLAGAIARYAQSRARAEIVAAGLLPWGGLLGQILTTIESGGDSTTVQAPITQITWQNAFDGGLPRTTIRTGFATNE